MNNSNFNSFDLYNNNFARTSGDNSFTNGYNYNNTSADDYNNKAPFFALPSFEDLTAFLDNPSNLFANPPFNQNQSFAQGSDNTFTTIDAIEDEGQDEEQDEKQDEAEDIARIDDATANLSATTNIPQPNDKAATKAKAEELRARLMAMKANAPQLYSTQPAIQKHEPSVTTTPARSGPSSTHLPNDRPTRSSCVTADIDSLIREGRAAALANDVRKSPSTSTRPSRPNAGTMPLPRTPTDRAINTQHSVNDATVTPARPVVADEAVQYRKLQELSARTTYSQAPKSTANESILTMPRTAIPPSHAGNPRTMEKPVGHYNHASGRENGQERPFDTHSAEPDVEETEDDKLRRSVAESITGPTNSPTPKMTMQKTKTPEAQDPQKYYEELDTWLVLTGYHDIVYRSRAITRYWRQKELEVQLQELKREADLEAIYRSRTRSIQPQPNEDVKPLVAPSMPPPLPPFIKTNGTHNATISVPIVPAPRKTADALETRPTKRSYSLEADSAVLLRSSKSLKIEGGRDDRAQMGTSTNGTYQTNLRYPRRSQAAVVPHRQRANTFEITTSPMSRRNESLERRISMPHGRHYSFSRDGYGRGDYARDDRGEAP